MLHANLKSNCNMEMERLMELSCRSSVLFTNPAAPCIAGRKGNIINIFTIATL